jgi:hypothetical protein
MPEEKVTLFSAEHVVGLCSGPLVTCCGRPVTRLTFHNLDNHEVGSVMNVCEVCGRSVHCLIYFITQEELETFKTQATED